MEEVKKSQYRLDVLKKMQENERVGNFDVCLENDPPASELLPNQIDYKRKKLSSKIKRFFTFKIAKKMLKSMEKAGQFKIKEFIGLENLQGVSTGAILTCNHFNPGDSFAMGLAFMEAKLKHKRLFRVISEANYTNPHAGFKPLMQYMNTLPLSRNKDTMKLFIKSIGELLEEGNFILIYPEQQMWWNYRKPRPLKNGAFHFAVKNNVPIIPVFITMEDSEVLDSDGFPVQIYTVHVDKPIYLDKDKSNAQNIKEMKEKNFEAWKDIYEKVYNKPLTYDTEVVTEDTDEVVKKYMKK